MGSVAVNNDVNLSGVNEVSVEKSYFQLPKDFDCAAGTLSRSNAFP